MPFAIGGADAGSGKGLRTCWVENHGRVNRGGDAPAQSWVSCSLAGSCPGTGVSGGLRPQKAHAQLARQRWSLVAQVLPELGKRQAGKESASTFTLPVHWKNHLVRAWIVCADHTDSGGQPWSANGPGGREDVLVRPGLRWVCGWPHEVAGPHGRGPLSWSPRARGWGRTQKSPKPRPRLDSPTLSHSVSRLDHPSREWRLGFHFGTAVAVVRKVTATGARASVKGRPHGAGWAVFPVSWGSACGALPSKCGSDGIRKEGLRWRRRLGALEGMGVGDS